MTPEEGREAVALARRSLEAHVSGEAMPAVPRTPGVFAELRGVFVTLNLVEGEEKLRGCIGFPYPTYPLGRAIREATAAAASEDPRFPPVVESELGSIVVEVSVLTPPSELLAKDRRTLPSKVRVGTDGLIVSNAFASGLLLPQVATEFGLDPTDFLSQTCLKAGLSPDAWLDNTTKVQVFQAEIFAEGKPRGEVSRVNPRGQ